MWHADDGTGRRRCGRGGWIVVPLLSTLLSTLPAADVNIVNIRTYHAMHSCPTECTGTMVTTLMVLTAARCTMNAERFVEETTTAEPSSAAAVTEAKTTSDTDATGGTANANATATATTAAAKSTTVAGDAGEAQSMTTVTKSVKITHGAIKVFTRIPSKSSQRFVTHKYMHPDWNPETSVADLVLIKINLRFEEFGAIIMPDMMEIDETLLPQKILFKGFGKINEKGEPMIRGKQSDAKDTDRELKITYAPDQCPYVKKDKIDNDTNWWSFLCTTPKGVRTTIMNTLCMPDTGGPLYTISDSGQPKLYGVFSHTYHTKFPFCASEVCFLLSDTLYPCNSIPDSLFYRHTALITRYTSWINRTLEWEQRLVTLPPSTPKCQTSSTTTLKPNATTLDPLYDVDAYDDLRKMVSNRKVCSSAECGSATSVSPGLRLLVGAIIVLPPLLLPPSVGRSCR